jgi:probable phosphoglycerate mutase
MTRTDEQLPQRGTTAEREANSRGRLQATVTVIRHGEPDWSPGGGRSVADPGLTPFGHAQARSTGRALADQRFDALYVSPYRRAQETAAAVSEALGLEPITIDGLAEVQVAVEGFDLAEVDRYFAEGAARPLAEHWDGLPGAETFHDFHGRVTSGIGEVLGRHECHPFRESEHDFTLWELPESSPSIAIVAHGGTNSVILTHLLDIRPVPWEWLRFETALAAYSVVQARPIGPRGHVWSLQGFNREDHLLADGLR